MWTIKDLVVGVILTLSTTKAKAIKKAQERVDYHNREFYYRKQQFHPSANCKMIVDEKNLVIIIK